MSESILILHSSGFSSVNGTLMGNWISVLPGTNGPIRSNRRQPIGHSGKNGYLFIFIVKHNNIKLHQPLGRWNQWGGTLWQWRLDKYQDNIYHHTPCDGTFCNRASMKSKKRLARGFLPSGTVATVRSTTKGTLLWKNSQWHCTGV
jgi:hypothetical protein